MNNFKVKIMVILLFCSISFILAQNNNNKKLLNPCLDRKSNKYIDITLPIAGSFSLIDRNATNSDRKLAAKIAITYAKSSTDKVYRVKVGSDILNVSPFTTKEEVQRYFFNVVVQNH